MFDNYDIVVGNTFISSTKPSVSYGTVSPFSVKSSVLRLSRGCRDVIDKMCAIKSSARNVVHTAHDQEMLTLRSAWAAPRSASSQPFTARYVD